MNRFLFPILLSALFISSLSAKRVPRKALVEELTSTSCTFCDLSDSLVISYEAEHEGQICMLKWYCDWSNRTGANPLYHSFEKGLDRIQSFYQSPGVPDLICNGQVRTNPYGHKTTTTIDTIFNKYLTQTSEFEMMVRQFIIGDSIECRVTIKVVDAPTYSPFMKLGIVISEREINFKENTEDAFAPSIHTNVVRGVVPDFDHGAPTIGLPPLHEGDTYDFTYRVAIKPEWNLDMIRTTAFIQNTGTTSREIYQSETSGAMESGVASSQSANSSSVAYPNPASSATVISYNQVIAGRTSISIYDMTGRECKTIVASGAEVGRHSEVLSVASLASGAYYYVVCTPGGLETHSLMVNH